jgi:hypothetical protein
LSNNQRFIGAETCPIKAPPGRQEEIKGDLLNWDKWCIHKNVVHLHRFLAINSFTATNALALMAEDNNKNPSGKALAI